MMSKLLFIPCPSPLVALGYYDGIGPFAVSSGTSGLLEISLYAVGRVEMQDKAHIGFVDTHSESIGRHHDAYAVVAPGLLAGIFFAVGKSCVEICGRVAELVQRARGLHTVLAVARIDDARTRITLQSSQHTECADGMIFHGVNEVCTVVAHAYHVLLTEIQLCLYVMDDILCGRCSECEDGNSWKFLAQLLYLQV